MPSCGGCDDDDDDDDVAAADNNNNNNNNNKYCYLLLGFTANFEILQSSFIVRSLELEIPRSNFFSCHFCCGVLILQTGGQGHECFVVYLLELSFCSFSFDLQLAQVVRRLGKQMLMTVTVCLLFYYLVYV